MIQNAKYSHKASQREEAVCDEFLECHSNKNKDSMLSLIKRAVTTDEEITALFRNL